ncbi:MAG: hypothetical protein CEN90_247 [Parcubacteria group bacterium Licking1014_17]|nr:MAG: hypothetical protein CEN90_247 [Parcubacteria group bacterium Licking1014_17]
MGIKLKNNRGSILLTTLLFCSFLMLITIELSAIFVPKIKTARDVRYSSAAIYAADSAMEYCLYVNKAGDAVEPPVMSIEGIQYFLFDPNVPTETFPPGDAVTMCAKNPLRATGRYMGVTRTLEISTPE